MDGMNVKFIPSFFIFQLSKYLICDIIVVNESFFYNCRHVIFKMYYHPVLRINILISGGTQYVR